MAHDCLRPDISSSVRDATVKATKAFVAVAVILSGAPSAAASSDLPLLSPPVDAQITQRFEEPRHNWGPGHRGIDYGVVAGTQLHAAAFGTVSFAGSVAGILAVTIDHRRGLESTYSQLAEVSVQAGDVVGAGTWIGVSGTSHSGLGSGLHLGVKLYGDYVDPEAHLGPVDASRAIHLTRLVYEVSEGSLLAENLSSPSWISFAIVCSNPTVGRRTASGERQPHGRHRWYASSTRGHPDDIFSVPARLGYEPVDTFRFSYRGSDGDRLARALRSGGHLGRPPRSRIGTLPNNDEDSVPRHPGRTIDPASGSTRKEGIVAPRHAVSGGFRVGRIDANGSRTSSRSRHPTAAHHSVGAAGAETSDSSLLGRGLALEAASRTGGGRGRSASTPRVSR